MQLSIITPIFNRLELTRACIESLPPTLAGWKYEWILIDDGSTDGTREYLETLPGEGRPFRLIFNEQPRGFAGNNNLGARRARASLLCLLNNDTVLRPGWLEPMTSLARLLPDVAFVGNVQREPVSGLVDHAGIFFDRDGAVHHFAKDQPAPPREDYLEWPAVTAACCVIRKKRFLDLGGFDEIYRNGHEDVDACLRAGARGYRNFVANRSVIFHHISSSPGRGRHEAGNRKIFLNRWRPAIRDAALQRRTVATERSAGLAYLRKHVWQPWRYNFWRVVRALGRVYSRRPPKRGLEWLPRLLLAARSFWREGDRAGGGFDLGRGVSGPVIYLVVGDTAQTANRSDLPTYVRRLAAAFGRTGAPVRLVAWRDSTRDLCLLPRDWSVGLDSERLRPADGKLSAPALLDPTMGQPDDPLAASTALHTLTGDDRPAPGAWIVLPEIFRRERASHWVEYVRDHGWRAAAILHDTMANNEPGWFPLTDPDAHEAYLRAVSRADMVVAVLTSVRADWERFLEAKELPRPVTRVCEPGADTCTADRALTAPASGGDGRVRILCVSTVEPRKNQRTLLAAFDLVREQRPDLDLELTLVGEPRLFNEDNVPAAVRAAQARHPDRITWHERVEYGALAALYERCDFTVFPSVLEGFAMPIYESLWSRRPCICANTGTMNDAADGGGCVTVDVTSAEALADAIITLAQSSERRGWLGDEIDRRPLRTWERCATELLGILREANPAVGNQVQTRDQSLG